MNDARFDAFMGNGGKRIFHWEHFSNPDAATYVTGIDYYEKPRTCILKMNEMYPFLELNAPKDDAPLLKPEKLRDKGHGRWGAEYRDYWQQDVASQRFASLDDMLKFSPLEQGDFSGWNVVVDGDFSDEEVIYRRYRKNYPEEWGNEARPGMASSVSFYNTMFMWPMLVFGYENFMLLCLDPEFERIMDEFAEINRRVFKAFARLPVNFVISHDDIVTPSGPVCSPEWMHKHIFPRYEEFWDILKKSGKEVIFMVDGCVDAFADDIMSCGAKGIISEPMTDYKRLAKKYRDCFIAGEGDCCVLMRNDKAEIHKMVERMVETANISKGYMMCIGNHIPFNVPPEAVKLYLDLSSKMGFREL